MNNKKVSKKKYIIIIIVLLILLSISVINTYARYESNDLGGEGEVKIAKWNVQILDGFTKQKLERITFDIDDNEGNVLQGHMAPGTSATAKIILDPKGSQVPIDYSFEINKSDLESTNIVIDSITAKVKESVTNLNNSENGVFFGDLSLEDVLAGESVLFTIRVKWANDENNSEEDTITGEVAGKISLPISITAKQHIDS